MFFRRMFARRGSNNNNGANDNSNSRNHIDEDNSLEVDYFLYGQQDSDKNNNSSHSGATKMQPRARNGTRKPPVQNSSSTTLGGSTTSLQRAASGGSAAIVQLSPLWEHILRTRTLPESISPVQLFAEFLERLRDPEWQVRQHALRVLVDVLVVMHARADTYMEPLVPQLVENLGHPAPTVRKGALDCLRVYLAETAMPETILLQILDIGLNQKITNEPFGGRLTCGVMLSLPALVQATLHTPKRHFILRATIDMLVQKMGQVTHQEITLKVLAKIRELIGEHEFVDFMSHGAFREYELLCNVYGVGMKPTPSKQHYTSSAGSGSAWRHQKRTPYNHADYYWRSSEEEQMLDSAAHGKLIMETEIKINDDTVTMRILEAKDEDTETEPSQSPQKSRNSSYPNSLEDEVICGRLVSAKSLRDAAGVIKLLSDSDNEDEVSNNQANTEYTPSTPSRTPKRVTFGGEVVKMRTPDSDNAAANNSDTQNNSANAQNSKLQNQSAVDAGGGDDSKESTSDSLSPENCNKTSALCVEIPSDNTKPLNTPTSAGAEARSTDSGATYSPIKRRDSSTSLSPRSPFKRLSVSPVDSIVSPKAAHKQIEVLHNLQRDPSPVRLKSAQRGNEAAEEREIRNENQARQQQLTASPQRAAPKSWEDLDIVSYDTLMDLRAGDWRLRLQGIAQLEQALRSSENLARVQPCLETLLRTLLSSERNADVAEEKRRLIMNLISRLPLDNLEDRTVQIMTGLCRQGGPGANRVCKALMQRLPPATIVLKLISEEFMHAKSSRFRENALQMVMYALMTFPSTCFDTATCVTSATYNALNRKRRVRQASLDVLAILGQVTTPRSVLEVVQGIAATRDEGPALVAAVKARLARKQLPLVTADGLVQYTVRVPSPQSPAEVIALDDEVLSPDIEWITAGVGSVSPTSLKRRFQRQRSCSQQSFCCLPQQDVAGGCGGSVASGSGSNHSDDSISRSRTFQTSLQMVGNAQHDNHAYNLQHMLGSSVPVQFGKKPSGGDFTNYLNRRLVAKSCSDSSMDGRSTDSTYTNSSGERRAAVAAAAGCAEAKDGGGITGRFTRQAVNSRFPAMERMDLSTTYARVHKPPTYYPGMGAYAHLQQQQYNMNSTYPKISYTQPQQQPRRRSHQQYAGLQQPAQTQSQYQHQKQFAMAQEHFKQNENHHAEPNQPANGDNLDGSYTIGQGVHPDSTAPKAGQHHQQQANSSSNNRRFVNVEKFKMQSNKYSQTHASTTAASPHPVEPSHQAVTPISVHSLAYSQKSTASAQTHVSAGSPSLTPAEPSTTDSQECSTPTTTLEGTVKEALDDNEVSDTPIKWTTGKEVLKIEDLVDAVTEAAILAVEEQQQQMPHKDSMMNRNGSLGSIHSKAESIKTQLDETPETLSRTQSNKSLFIEEDIELMPSSSSSSKGRTSACEQIDIGDQKPVSADSMRSCGARSPTIEEMKRNSLSKSMEALYIRKFDSSLDTTTETSSQSSAQMATTLPIKPQHTPLKQKSKTTHSLKNNRRVSPVKQSIKMAQPELFPTTLQRFEKPREALLKTFDQLDSANWEVNITGLKSLVRMMRYHPEHLDNQMHMVCIHLTRSARNLRSQVSRAACQAAGELFTLKTLKSLEQECDDLVCALLHRTADTNRFLRADASRALDSMCDNLQPSKVLNVIASKGAQHQHALVRTSAARLLHRLVERLSYEKVFTMQREQRDKVIITTANLMQEGSLETRGYAKQIFRLLSEHPNCNRLLKEIIPNRIYRNIEKTLRSIQ